MSAPPPAALIAIVGSYDPERTDELALKNTGLAPEAAKELGRELARQGCHIVVYATYPFLMEVDVVRGYFEIKKDKPEKGCIQVRYSVTVNYKLPPFDQEKDDQWEMFD